MEKEEIKDILKDCGVQPKDYTMDKYSGDVHFKCSVTLRGMKLRQAIHKNSGILPFKISAADGDLIMNRIGLVSMLNLPPKVNGDLNIQNNAIKMFGFVTEVGGSLFAGNNKIISVDNIPKVGASIDVSDNQLVTIDKIQTEINGDLSVNNNKIKVIPKIKVGGALYASNNLLVSEPAEDVAEVMIFENNPCNPSDEMDRAMW